MGFSGTIASEMSLVKVDAEQFAWYEGVGYFLSTANVWDVGNESQPGTSETKSPLRREKNAPKCSNQPRREMGHQRNES